MQRSAASSTTPTSTKSRTPGSDSPYKRRRVDNESESSNPSTPKEILVDRNAVSAALKAEQDLISQARLKNAREGDESQWFLNIQLPKPSQSMKSQTHINGDEFGGDDIEAEELDDIWRDVTTGRQTYGSFRKRNKHLDHPIEHENDDDDQESVSSDDGSASPASSPRTTSKKPPRKREPPWTPKSNKSLLSSATGLRFYDHNDKRKRKVENNKGGRKKPRKTI